MYPLIRLLASDLEEQTLEQYACLSKYRPKPAYAPTAESSVYVDSRVRGQGVGEALMRELLKRAALGRFHSVVAGIVSGNVASARLHEKLGFARVGLLREVGWKFGAWQDVQLYQWFLAQ